METATTRRGSGLQGASRSDSLMHFAQVSAQGISQDRVIQLATTVRRLSTVDPGRLANPNQHSGGDADMRRAMRYLVCVLPGDTPPEALALRVHEVVNNPRLPLAQVSEVLYSSGPAASAVELHAVAADLREGLTLSEVVERQGAGRETVQAVSSFLGATQAREDRMEALLFDALTEPPVSLSELAEVLPVSKRTVRRRLKAMCERNEFCYETRVSA